MDPQGYDRLADELLNHPDAPDPSDRGILCLIVRSIPSSTVANTDDHLIETIADNHSVDPDEVTDRMIARNPGTGQVGFIGLRRTGENDVTVLINADNRPEPDDAWTTDDISGLDHHYLHADEALILRVTNRLLETFDQRIVTYDGLVFDGPFLMIRMAHHDLTIQRNLSPSPFALTNHTDLREVLTNFRSRPGNEPLEFWARTIGRTRFEIDLSPQYTIELFDENQFTTLCEQARNILVGINRLYDRTRSLTHAIEDAT